MRPEELRRSVPEGIAARLRDQILSGKIRPDTPLREVALAEEYGASRNTVREALVHLEHQGLARKSAHRGTRVARPDRAEIREILAYRRVVEPGAVRRVLTTVGPGAATLLDRLDDRAEEMEAAAAEDDWERYGVLDLRFHAELVEGAGSARLADTFRRSVQPLRLHLLAADLTRLDPGSRAHVAEHRMLVGHIRRADATAALDLIDRHLLDAETALFRSEA